MELFAQAAKSKLRFQVSSDEFKIHGIVDTEDLWTLPLKVLDELAKALNSKLQENQVSFISTEVADKVVQLKFDVVKAVIDYRLEEQKAQKQTQENQAKKQRLLELKHQRQNEKFAQLSEEEIDKQLAELE